MEKLTSSSNAPYGVPSRVKYRRMNLMDQVSDPAIPGRWPIMEEALRKCHLQATAGQFAVSVMHEINNPLEAVSNLAYLVNEEAGNPAKVREYIRLIEEQLQSVRTIARQTLSFYRQATVPQPVDLVALAEAALRIHERMISAKQLRLRKDLPVEATAHVYPGEILQAVSNLLANAVDALHENGTLHLRIRKRAQEVHLTIADNGHGIPPETLNKVFQPFFTTKEERGTGLGLAIAKTIVDHHGGRIRPRSSIRDGRTGTAFRISLPLDHGNRSARN